MHHYKQFKCGVLDLVELFLTGQTCAANPPDKGHVRTCLITMVLGYAVYTYIRMADECSGEDVEY
jgi:hypothetical protein